MPNRPMLILAALLAITAAAIAGPAGLALLVLDAGLVAVAVERAPERSC